MAKVRVYDTFDLTIPQDMNDTYKLQHSTVASIYFVANLKDKVSLWKKNSIESIDLKIAKGEFALETIEENLVDGSFYEVIKELSLYCFIK